MPRWNPASLAFCTALAAGFSAGCESLPAEEGILFTGMGAKLAAAEAATPETSRPVSALLGGALGFGGGYIVGVRADRLDQQSRSVQRAAALCANDRAERNPADVEDVRAAPSADLNSDGFITVDEIIALEQAGLSDEQEVERLGATGYLFELSQQQERYLEDRGISLTVVDGIRRLSGGAKRHSDSVGV